MQKKGNMMHVAHNEEIIAVVPKSCSGPGWSNSIFNIYILRRDTRVIRHEIVQYDEVSDEMMTLFQVAMAVNASMLHEAERWVTKLQDSG